MCLLSHFLLAGFPHMLTLDYYSVMWKSMNCDFCKPTSFSSCSLNSGLQKYVLLFVRPLMHLSNCMFYMCNTVLGAKYTFLWYSG